MRWIDGYLLLVGAATMGGLNFALLAAESRAAEAESFKETAPDSQRMPTVPETKPSFFCAVT